VPQKGERGMGMEREVEIGRGGGVELDDAGRDG